MKALVEGRRRIQISFTGEFSSGVLDITGSGGWMIGLRSLVSKLLTLILTFLTGILANFKGEVNQDN